MLEQNLKVCVIARHIGTEGTASVGIGRVAQELVRGLLSRGVYVESIDTSNFSLPSYLWFSLVGIPLSLPRNFDVYHALGPIESLWLPKRKSVVTFMDLFQFTDPDKVGAGLEKNSIVNKLGSSYFKFCSKIAVKRASKIACISEKTKYEVEHYIGGKAEVIRCGIPSYLEPSPKLDPILTFGYLGVLDKRKRVNLLIKAFRETAPEQSRLLIAGRGPEEAYLKMLAEGDSRIEFKGYIEENQLCNFYNMLDYFIFPTALEGYGLPMIEAMACKKAVIVLGDAKIPEEVKSQCWVVKDLDSFFSVVREGLIDKDFGTEENYKWAREHSWSKMVDQYLDLYRELV